MGKGTQRRPSDIPERQLAENWSRTFGLCSEMPANRVRMPVEAPKPAEPGYGGLPCSDAVYDETGRS